jgi:hypothetical protein
LDTWAEEEHNDAVLDKFNERTVMALHSDRNWRSALEIIIHQVRSQCSVPHGRRIVACPA